MQHIVWCPISRVPAIWARYFTYFSVVEEEHTEAHISLVNYEFSWQKHGRTYFQCQVPQESITHRGKQWNLPTYDRHHSLKYVQLCYK